MSGHGSPGAAAAPEQLDAERWPMRICLMRRKVSNGRWEADQWSIAEIESDRQDPPQELSCEIGSVPLGAPPADIFIWRGLWLELHRDERAAYRFNLGSAAPKLFVNCNADESGRMEPKLITASQDVAASYMDGGEEDVFSIAMPTAIQCWIEAFIARHGEPEIQLGKGRHRDHDGARKQGKRNA